MANKRRTVAIIGLGAFGTVLARELTRMGDIVIGLDRDESRVSQICDEIESAMQVDASDMKSLKQCGLDVCDCIMVSIGEDMQASILTAMNVQELGCPILWVKAQSLEHIKILKALGITNIVHAEQDYGLRVAQVIHNPRVSDYLSLGKGKYIAEIKVPEQLTSTKIGDLRLDPHGLRCLGVFREGALLETEIAKITLVADDSLLIYGERPDLRRFADEF
ncbi:potassium channel family protein [Henriciella litoralis]|uniref:potassium channel family protein n=1 Tax=Henriciella litoralis TaxID=568102 RepID=UPI0009FD8A86|nr:TrkA family potassium uptake protein [Henriciella litoralis]